MSSLSDNIAQMSNEQLMVLYKKTNDQSIKQELTLRYIYLLKIIARQMKGVYASFSEFDDMINEGIIALMSAIDNFDIQKNVKFESYASLRIRGTIIDVARKQDWVSRSVRKSVKQIDAAVSLLHNKLQREPTDDEIAAELNISKARYLKLLADSNLCNILSLNTIMTEQLPEIGMKPVGNSDINTSPEVQIQKKEMSQKLKDAIEGLKENERIVISLYYNEELSIKEIAKVLSLSESRISQIHSKALINLKRILGGYVKS